MTFGGILTNFYGICVVYAGLNNQDMAPIRLNDERLSFLDSIVNWLDCWKAWPPSRGKLTPQTFTIFRHTCIALPMLVQRLTQECGFEYLLTSRIQNDY